MANGFIGIPIGTLTSLQSTYIDCITAIASNQSYTLNGRSVMRADLGKVQDVLANINAALAVAQGTSTSQSFVSFTGL
jgi:hypothetical protein